VDDVVGAAFFVAIALVGIASTVLASIWTWRLLRRRDVDALPAAVIVSVAAVLAFWGLWVVFDVCWIAVALVRLTARAVGGAGRPAATAAEGRSVAGPQRLATYPGSLNVIRGYADAGAAHLGAELAEQHDELRLRRLLHHGIGGVFAF
jgi:hypothetical protein